MININPRPDAAHYRREYTDVALLQNINNIMNNSESHNTGKIISALLVGTLLGAGLTWLFNTESGNEMKEKLTSEIKDALGGLKDKMKSEHCPECGCKKEEESAKQA
jgi:hypothetical protein